MNKHNTKKAHLFSPSESFRASNFENVESESLTPNSSTNLSLNSCLLQKNATNSSPNSQKKNLDVGDLHILILNHEKNRELFNFEYCQKPSCENVLNVPLNGQNESQKLEKEHQGTIKIKIFEDELGKRSYEFVLDFPKNLKMKSRTEKEGYVLENPNSKCHLKINSQKTETGLREDNSRASLLNHHSENNFNNFSPRKF